jgi:molybdopterin/thiamine biosynthesis adenylyltransferase
MPGTFHHEQLYRGGDIVAKLSQLRIVICGVGALGSNLADTLVRQGVTKLRLIDHDRVEQHNIGTQVYALSEIGQFKADALRKLLFRVAGVEAEAVRKELTAANAKSLLKDADLIIDAFDNSASRQLVQDFARSSKVATLHVGLFADFGQVAWDETYRVPKDVAGDVCDYPLARNLIVITTAVAAESIVAFAGAGQRKSWTITLRDLAICEA